MADYRPLLLQDGLHDGRDPELLNDHFFGVLRLELNRHLLFQRGVLLEVGALLEGKL